MHQWEAMPRVAMWPAPATWHSIPGMNLKSFSLCRRVSVVN